MIRRTAHCLFGRFTCNMKHERETEAGCATPAQRIWPKTFSDCVGNEALRLYPLVSHRCTKTLATDHGGANRCIGLRA
jgi:hypothetical protein